MLDLRPVTDTFAVSPQIAPEDVATLKAQGFTTIVNNRPDGEAPDQPAGAALASEAAAQGLTYVEAPVRGAPTLEQGRATAEAADSAEGKTLAFCKSGTRSIAAWSLGQAASGARAPDDLVALAADAGYDLTPLAGLIQGAAAGPRG